MKNLAFKRLGAYVLDIFIITLFVLLLNQLSYLNWTYEDYRIASEEYTELIDNSEDLASLQETDEYKKAVYDLSKYGQVYMIVDIIVYIGYFIFFQFYNKGQTLGKKLMKIKVVSEDNTDVTLTSIIIRSILIYSIIITTALVILINILSMDTYVSVSAIINNAFTLFTTVVLISVLFKKDDRGIHDMIAKTKVIKVEK